MKPLENNETRVPVGHLLRALVVPFSWALAGPFSWALVGPALVGPFPWAAGPALKLLFGLPLGRSWALPLGPGSAHPEHIQRADTLSTQIKSWRQDANSMSLHTEQKLSIALGGSIV